MRVGFVMELRRLVAELAVQRIRDYLSEEPVSGLVPRLFPPAGEAKIVALGVYAKQPLDPDYREFLSLTDGMDGFFPDMRMLGCKDRVNEGSELRALQFLEVLRDAGTPVDVGLPEDVSLFPVAIDEDASRGIFMLYAPRVLQERFWWVGEGDSMFFHTFADVLGYLLDANSYEPRDFID